MERRKRGRPCKSSRKLSVGFSLSPEVIQALKALSERRSYSEVLEGILRRYFGLKEQSANLPHNVGDASPVKTL